MGAVTAVNSSSRILGQTGNERASVTLSHIKGLLGQLCGEVRSIRNATSLVRSLPAVMTREQQTLVYRWDARRLTSLGVR